MGISRQVTVLATAGSLALAGLTAFAPGLTTGTYTAAALPLMFVLPGLLAITAVLPAARPGLVLGSLLVLATSISLDIVAGVTIGLAGGRLDRTSWALALGGIALAGGLAATLRAPSRPLGARPQLAPVLAMVLLVALAAAGATALLRNAGTTPSADGVQGYSALSVVRAGGQRAATLAVTSSELARRTFVLRVSSGGPKPILQETVVLSPGQTWRRTVAIPRGVKRLDADLLADGRVYRRVALVVS